MQWISHQGPNLSYFCPPTKKGGEAHGMEGFGLDVDIVPRFTYALRDNDIYPSAKQAQNIFLIGLMMTSRLC
jgi:hypothetical protein